MTMHDDSSERITQRARRLRERALNAEERGYSEKTHLIHGRSPSARWNYRHQVVPPMTSSVTYRLDTAKRGAQGFTEFGEGHGERREPIYIYDRLDEPNRGMLEENLSYAEGGEMGVTFASGMAAISAAVCCLATSGQEVVAHHMLYGCTFSLFTKWLPRFGIKVRGVNLGDETEFRSSITPQTRVVYFETPVNPTLELIDIGKIASIVSEVNENRTSEERISIVVDNTFATPYCQRPLELGADVVVASLTKSIGGFGTDLGGVVIGARSLEGPLMGFRKDFGAVLSPKAAWPILVYGLPTLSIRIRQQQETAMKVAQFLEADDRVERVFYPGLESFPQYDLARQQLTDYEGQFAPGILLYFTLKDSAGDGKIGERFIDYLAEESYCITMAVSLGQVKTLVEHPFSMTHSSLSCSDKAGHLVDPAGLRLSIGLEKGDDLIADLRSALDHVS